MKRKYRIKIVILSLILGFTTKSPAQVLFEQNFGQVKNQFGEPNKTVFYTATHKQFSVHFKSKGMSYQLSKPLPLEDIAHNPLSVKKMVSSGKTEFYRVDLQWLNASGQLIEPSQQAISTTNYYSSESTYLNVHSYQIITYKNLYPFIDLKWYSVKSNLKYDFILNPGSDPRAIQLQIKGANLSINKAGELVIQTPLGNLIEEAPIAFQGKQTIPVSWQLNGNVVSFKVSDYDKSLPLTIDPMIRYWGTYYGGSGNDFAYGNTVDNNGDVYICGYTQSTGNIATAGSHQLVYAGGTNDAFVAKFNTNGVRLWGTYYGGTTLDVATAITFDATNNLYVSGYTDSNSGISTPGAHQSSLNGNVDAFLVKFNSNGVRQWGTYYNGIMNAYGQGVTIDNLGNVILCGYTSSTGGTAIATSAAHQSVYGGGAWDAFVAKFSPTGTRLWGTYYGDFGAEYAFGCDADNAGNIYIVGNSTSNTGTNIASAASHQPTFGGGSKDAYLVKFNSSGVRQWATYYGGFNEETGSGCNVDAAGSIYISGSTDTGGGILVCSPGAHQTIFGGGFADAYLAKFNSAGTRIWGTLYGGIDYEDGVSCFTDAVNDVYLTGQTGSSTGTVMATSSSYQSVFGGGSFDGYLVKFDGTNGTRKWGTYYGEIGNDYPLAGCIDINYNIYIAGRSSTNSGIAIASMGSHQSVYGGGGFDGFLVKLYDCPEVLADIISTQVTCNGYANGTASVIINSNPTGLTYSWSPTGGNSVLATGLAPNVYTCIVTSTCGSAATLTTTITQPSAAAVAITSSQPSLCAGSSATLTASGSGPSGPFTYTWSSGFSGSNLIITPTVTSTYTVNANSVNNCTAQSTYTQFVLTCTDLESNNSKTESIQLIPNPAKNNFCIHRNDLAYYTVEIYDGIGKRIYRRKEVNGNLNVDCSTFSKGIYIIKINSESSKDSKFLKLVVE
ncbi:MAG: T9SS type A sorting domain-containing protein [Bacteroidetes bacterium]|nr:T9SS type A sorting domain-containing protein [Bacteroidota bacterium]MCA6443723.1 T9SS type A sorting domain-containing protein [Bacteroidota bacterium]